MTRVLHPHQTLRACYALAAMLAGFLPAGARAQEPAPDVPDRDRVLVEAFADVAERVAPSVVRVLRTGKGTESGLGVLVGNGAEVLTSARLLDGPDGLVTRVTLVLADGRELNAAVAGRRGELDVAMLRLAEAPAGTTPVRTGDSRGLTPGSLVFSVATDGLLSGGFVGAVGRRVGWERRVPSGGVFGVFGSPNQTPLRPFEEVFQHDGRLLAGQFGGPVVDSLGRLVGINVASFYRGSSFAAPWHRIEAVLDDLRAGRNVSCPRSYGPPPGQASDDLQANLLAGLDEAIDRLLADPDSPLRRLLMDLFGDLPDSPVRRALDDLDRQREAGEAGEDGEDAEPQAQDAPKANADKRSRAMRDTRTRDKQADDPKPRHRHGARSGPGYLGIRGGAAHGEGGGVLVKQVHSDTPAERAGLKPGDVILGFNNRPVEGVADLATAVRETPAGSRVRLRVLRIGEDLSEQHMTLSLKLAARPETETETEAETPDDPAKADDETSDDEDTGETVPASTSQDDQAVENDEDAADEQEPQPGFLGVGILEGDEGPRVGYVVPGGPADQAGFKRGDEIRKLGRKRIRNVEAFEAAFGNRHAGDKLRFTVLRGDQEVVLEVTLGARER